LGFAVTKNNNTWGLFNDLAYKDVKIIISEQPLGNLGYIETKLAKQSTVGVVVSITGTGVVVGVISTNETGNGGGDNGGGGDSSAGSGGGGGGNNPPGNDNNSIGENNSSSSDNSSDIIINSDEDDDEENR